MEGQELFEGLISLSRYKPHTITQHRYLIEKVIVNKYNGNNYRIIAISKYGVLTELINIEYYLDVHIEDIATKKLNNIVLLDVDCMNTDYFRELIRIKSKKTNIIGINIRYDEIFKDFLVFVNTLKDQKATDEEISIGLRLKYSDNIINHYFDYNKYYKNVKIKEIESVDEVIKYIKR